MFTFLLTSICLTGYSQSPDKLYEEFSKSYEKLDPVLLGNLYATDAVLINMYDNNEPTSLKGKAPITQFFRKLFERAQQEGTSLNITFKVTSRQQVGDQLLDNGFYHLVVSTVKESYDRYGKFSIVHKKESGEWKFATDANSTATREEFDNSTSYLSKK